MRRCVALLAAVLASSGASVARAHGKPGEMFDEFREPMARGRTVTDPGYFNAIGVPGRSWEIRSDTAFGTNRVFTERVELGKACRITDLFHVVTRASFGGAADTKTGLFTLQGPQVSLGAKLMSKDAHFWIEVGPRLLLPWPNPNDRDPHAITLARDATLTSAVADDATWLTFSDVGLQLYLAVQTRVCTSKSCGFLLGAQYGGALSVFGTGHVQSWLGPQKGVVGNAFFEVFATIPKIVKAVGFQLGARAEVSLSSIWPGDQPFPFFGGPFLGWSPVEWFSARAFFGWAGTAGDGPVTMPYGVRLQFFLP